MSISNPAYEPHGLEAIDANGPSLLLAEHHRCLDLAGRALLGWAYEDDPIELVAEYREFEAQVLEHMAAEEELILPGFSEAYPQEAGAIRVAHAELRHMLDNTAIEIELHAARVGTLRDVLRVLAEHSRREDKVMYPWAQVHLAASSRRTLADRIRASLDELRKLVRGVRTEPRR